MTPRCEGRYLAPQTAPPRGEPFDVTYRCGLFQGHDGNCGPWTGTGKSVVEQADEAAASSESLGLSIDMLHVDLLREWAWRLLIHGSDVGHWGSVPFVASKMQTIATGIEKAVRDIGTLRALASAATPATEGQTCDYGAALVKDAQRYRTLRDTLSGAVGGGIEVNDERLVYRQPVPGEAVRVFWYPNTPVGFNEVKADTLDAAIDSIAEGQGHAATPAGIEQRCWHGHTTRKVGCVSCVLVFDRQPAPPAALDREALVTAWNEGVRFAAEMLGGTVIPGRQAKEACIDRVLTLLNRHAPAREETGR